MAKQCPLCSSTSIERRGFLGVCLKCGLKKRYENFPEVTGGKTMTVSKLVERVEELTVEIIKQFLRLSELLNVRAAKEFYLEEPPKGKSLTELLHRYEAAKNMERRFVRLYLNWDVPDLQTFGSLLYAFCGALGVDPPLLEGQKWLPLTNHLDRLRSKLQHRLDYLEAVHQGVRDLITQLTKEVLDYDSKGVEA